MDADNLYRLTATDAAERIRQRRLSSVAFIEALLERIDQLDPKLHAWVTVDREGALDTARQADEDLRTRGPRGPLHGVPIGVKDIFNVTGLPTAAGSRIYRDFVPQEDATSIARLKAQGAIVLGKTVTTEFAFIDPPPTRNPWNAERTPGGSSSGSAVAVATGMCPLALGSQTAGSTLRPAAYNAVIGFKPTYGRISRVGVFPLAWTLDTVGLFARSVEDVALLLQTMAGHDPRDPFSAREPVPDCLTQMAQARARAPRIGFIHGFFDERADAAVWAHTLEVVERLRAAGADVREVTVPESFGSAIDVHFTVMATEAAAIHRKTHAQRPQDYSPKMRAFVEQGLAIPGVDYLQAQQWRRRFRSEVERLLDGRDALLTPATPAAAPRDLSTTGDPSFQTPWTFAGLPAVSLPSGLDAQGLPLGVQLVGRSFAEGTLLGIAAWCLEMAIDRPLVPVDPAV
jgi:aspartyl-tRNA(Asn)/glutamyl-tRNA(Gln) amidotransferase subunit A